MELIHTLGIAIDPSAAKSGSAQAAAAFQQVSQAARATGAAAQTVAKGLGGPLKAALGAVKESLSMMVGDLYDASTSLAKLQRQLKFASADSADFRQNLGFLRGVAQELGLEFAATGEAFAKFAAAAKGKLSSNQIRDTFLAVTEASVAMGQGIDHTSDVLKVLGEMLGKGAVKADDLRGQLSEKLPGAFTLLAQSMGLSEEKLAKVLDTGGMMADDLVPKLAKALHETMGPGAAEGAKSLQSEMNRLKNTWAEVQAVVMSEGGESLFGQALRGAHEALEDLVGWLAALFEANKQGRLSEAIAASLKVGFGKAANWFGGFLTVAAKSMSEIGSKLFSSEFFINLAGAFASVAASFGLAVLDALRKPLAWLQAQIESIFTKAIRYFDVFSFSPESSIRRNQTSKAIDELLQDARFRGRDPINDLGLQSVQIREGNITRMGWQVDPLVPAETDVTFREALNKKLGELTTQQRYDEILATDGVRFDFGSGPMSIGDAIKKNQANQNFFFTALTKQMADMALLSLSNWKDIKPSNIIDTTESQDFLSGLRLQSKNRFSQPAPEPKYTGEQSPIGSLIPVPLTLSREPSVPSEPAPEPTPSLFSRFRQGLQQGTEGFTDAVQQMQTAGAETARALTSDFADFFTSSIEGTKSLGAAFRDMAASILRDIERILVHRLIAEPIVGAITHTLGLPTTKSHHGGLVGAGGGMSTLVNPLLFLGAPRLHQGLAPDEFPAILQRGERVVPKSQTGAWDRGGGDININVNVDGSRGGTPAQNKAFGAEVARQIEAMVDARIARAAMPRGILRPAASYA